MQARSCPKAWAPRRTFVHRATRQSVREQLALFQAMGVKRLVALRGDLPSGYGAGGEFQYASDLVASSAPKRGDFHQSRWRPTQRCIPRPSRPRRTCRPT